jgi:hypothetical protein
MTDAETVARTHRNIRRYVLPGERVVLSARSHWGKLAEPVLTTAAGFLLLAFVVVPAAGAVAGESADWLWWLFAVLLVRLGWKVLDWRNEWFVATDKRMLLLYGLVTHKVAMMPLVKITDMRYSRSVVGRVLGYGEFLLESAGQDQAMRRINWVARPDATYRELCATIFTPSAFPTAPGTRLPVPGMLPGYGYGSTPAAPVHGPVPSPVPVPGSGHGERRDPVHGVAWPPVPAPVPAPYRPDHDAHHDRQRDAPREPAYRPGDTQPIRIPPRPADQGWDVSGDRATFVPVEDQEARDRAYDD